MSNRYLRVAVGLLGILVAISASRCGRTDRVAAAAQPTTTHAFSVLEGSTPRMFFVNRSRYVDFQLRNDGYITWEPEAEFNVSYFWSSSTDQDDSGARTPITVSVPPGGTVDVRVLFKRPESLGLHRLQLDMVQESVTWFSDRDRSPQLARRVLVLPPLEIFSALLLPLLVTLGALGLAWRAIRKPQALPLDKSPRTLGFVLAFAEVAWCVVSLWGKQELFYTELPQAFLPALGWTTTATVGLLTVGLLLVPWRLRPWAAWLVVLAGSIDIWGQLLYHRFFADVAGSTTFLAARQSVHLLESARYLTTATDLWLALDLVVAIPLCLLLFRLRQQVSGSASAAGWVPGPGARRLAGVIVTLVLLSLSGPMLIRLVHSEASASSRNLQTLRSVRDHGLYGFQILDLMDFFRRSARPDLDDNRRQELLEQLQTTAPARASVGPMAGLATGRNLLAIQVESMQHFVLEYRVGNTEITPTLNRFARQALIAGSVLDQTGSGRSSSGDFVTTTGLLPVAEPVVYQYVENRYRTFAHVLSERGYTTLSAIPYMGYFWNRQRTHPAYGFETNLFRRDFEPGRKVGWGTNDLEFLRQMVPKLVELDRPFCAWLSTLSLHYPYRQFPNDLKTIDLGDLENTPLGNYLHGMNLLDRAFAELLEALEAAGLLDQTIIALWGDHASGLLKDEEYIEYFDLAGAPAAPLLLRRVPFVVSAPGTPPTDGPLQPGWNAGQVDIAPTLLALLGLDPAGLAYVGRNLLGEPGPAPAVHPTGWWVQDGLAFQGSIDNPGGTCWTLENGPQDLKPAPLETCAQGRAWAARAVEVSRLLTEYDLQADLSDELANQLNR